MWQWRGVGRSFPEWKQRMIGACVGPPGALQLLLDNHSLTINTTSQCCNST